jgi:hypothetical protein
VGTPQSPLWRNIVPLDLVLRKTPVSVEAQTCAQPFEGIPGVSVEIRGRMLGRKVCVGVILQDFDGAQRRSRHFPAMHRQ